jgi:chorismate--pyruvate lyase
MVMPITLDRWLPALLGTPSCRRWLTDHGSLTQALRSRCPGLRVVRLRQEMARPNFDERRPLGLSPGRVALIREVLLSCGDQPLIFAHSVIPETGLDGPWRGLSSLGNRPLGAALFSDPRVVRHPLQFRRVDARHALYRAAARHLADHPPDLWARRSLFSRQGRPILVTEVFLPEALRLPPPTLRFEARHDPE